MKGIHIIFLSALLITLSVIGIVHYNISWEDLGSLAFYENLANPSVRLVQIQEGWRKEQVANALALKLGWSDEEKDSFLSAHTAYGKTTSEGFYFPKTYFIEKDSAPEEVSKLMIDEFDKKTKGIKKTKETRIVNDDTALIIASIIQREAGGASDMRLISGILWNRIFKGMKLQVDATLQYAKGDEDMWWPPVASEDKYIKSPYNTYIYPLPPAPIANPGIKAIEAAYNPQKTSCLFYLHDKKRNIHCSPTYEGHKKNIDRYY
jgi:UPF0755 protein